MTAPIMVRRSWADGTGSETITLDEAAVRLAGYGYTLENAESLLREGIMLRTPFAFYQVVAAEITHPHPVDGTHEGLRRDCAACDAEDVEIPELELRALDGDR